MPAFLRESSGPGQVVVDPRKTIRIWWFYYQVEGDDVLQYYKILWKPATIKGWTDPQVKSAYVGPNDMFYNLAANTWTLDSAYSWRIEAWVQDKDYDPDAPPLNPDTGLPWSPPLPTADFFISSSIDMIVDTSGYVNWAERDKVVASGAVGFSTVSQTYTGFTLNPADPGDYEIRFRVSNGFQWSAYSTPVALKQYDTRRWVNKAGNIWWAVPDWKKTGGTMTRVKK